MSGYSLDQWVLFFIFYCFCGWVWESGYVSMRKRHWVNRGFLHGPLLPIYGFGALIILIATIRVQNNLWLVYLFGMAAATALEYATGAAMESLFKVRYWDYSHQRFQLNGYICLSSSLAWGAFSLLLVRVVHPPVVRLVERLPAALMPPLTLVLAMAVTVDAVRSFQAAMDLREMLTRLTEENEELRRLARRVEVISAFAEEDLQKFRDRTQVERILLQDKLEAQRTQRNQARAQRRLRREEALEESLRVISSAKLRATKNIVSALEEYRGKLGDTLPIEALAERRAEIQAGLEQMRDREAAIRTRTARTYRKSMRILRGNPTASAREYEEAMESLRELDVRNRKD